jgi:redox-sensitive bicupin YhaK (pirin superfamily)
MAAARPYIYALNYSGAPDMIERRPFASLGGDKLDWLDTHHHFSFAHYHDPARMGWGALRVWNDDEIAAGTGFPPHGHADMEIITYVRQGAISHEDSLGNKGRTVAGDVQVMSAGSGIRHAEYNHESAPTRIFQIWIVPTRKGGPSRKTIARAASSPWRAAMRPIPRRCRSAPMRAFSAPGSKRARRSSMPCGRGATPISCRRAAPSQ